VLCRKRISMAHKRKDTLVKPNSWNRHLRPKGKRVYHARERRHAQAEIKKWEDTPDECKE